MRIWLHIGLQKTGTTAMQQWFAQNAAELRAAGLLYLQLREGLAACGPLTNALSQNRPELAQMLARLREEIAQNHHCSQALLSNEGFSQESPAILHPLIAAFAGHEIGFIVTLRRQDRLAEALYKQVVKYNGASGDAAHFLRSRHLKVLDYAALLHEWQTAFPDAPFKVLLYEEEGGDSIAQMLDALGLGDMTPPDSAAFRRNITPAAELIEAYRQVPQEQAKALRRANQKLMAQYEAAAARHDDIFDQETRAALLRHYEAANQWVLARYFPERAYLFAPPREEQSPPLAAEILREFRHRLAKELKRL